MPLVTEEAQARDFIPILEEHGYEYRQNGDTRDRRFLVKGPHTNRTHYFSITEQGTGFHEEKLAFREYLRAHLDVAVEYEVVKRGLTVNYPGDRETYTRRKGPFIENILQSAVNDR